MKIETKLGMIATALFFIIIGVLTFAIIRGPVVPETMEVNIVGWVDGRPDGVKYIIIEKNGDTGLIPDKKHIIFNQLKK